MKLRYFVPTLCKTSNGNELDLLLFTVDAPDEQAAKDAVPGLATCVYTIDNLIAMDCDRADYVATPILPTGDDEEAGDVPA